MTYQDFKAEWNGRRVDYDNVYAYQCVDLILQFLKECGGVSTGVWGNAIDYAQAPTATFSSSVRKINDNTDKQAGDILVFSGLAGNHYGHIAIRDEAVNKMLEQNGMTGNGHGTGRDAIGVYREIPYYRLVATYRLNNFFKAPKPPVFNANVHLPAHVDSWRAYRVGSGLRPSTSDQVAVLAPSRYGGLDYHIEAWVGDYAVVVQTQMFGRVVLWVKNTDAEIN